MFSFLFNIFRIYTILKLWRKLQKVVCTMLGTTKNCQLKCFFATNWCKCKWNLHNVNTFSHFFQGQPLRHRIACIAYFSLGYSFFMVLVYNSKLHHCAEEASHLRVTVQDVNECEKCKKPIKARNGDKWRRHQKKKKNVVLYVFACVICMSWQWSSKHIFLNEKPTKRVQSKPVSV